MRDYDRDELLALTPERYLANGFLDEAGRPRRELQGEFATAAATQLLDAGLSPQELAFTYEALRQVLSLQDGAPRHRAESALDEAAEIVGRMIRQPNNEGLLQWLRGCTSMVAAPADLDALLGHVQATLRQYAAFAAVPQPASSSLPQAPGSLQAPV